MPVNPGERKPHTDWKQLTTTREVAGIGVLWFGCLTTSIQWAHMGLPCTYGDVHVNCFFHGSINRLSR